MHDLHDLVRLDVEWMPGRTKSSPRSMALRLTNPLGDEEESTVQMT